MFETVVLEYGLSGKMRYIITDNASNMKKAFTTSFPSEDERDDEDAICTDDDELWVDYGEATDAIQDTPGRHLRCFAHSLQLAVKDGLKKTRFVCHVRKSVAIQMFDNCCGY